MLTSRRSLMLGSLGLGLTGAPGFAQSAAKTAKATDSWVFIGTHGTAILGARLDSRTGELTLTGEAGQVERPTWLVADPKRPLLYSVSETGNDGKSNGGVVSLRIDPA